MRVERKESGPCSTTMAAGRESPDRSEDKTLSHRQNEGKTCTHYFEMTKIPVMLMPFVALLASR